MTELKHNELFIEEFYNFNIDENHPTQTIAKIIYFYMNNIALHTTKYYMLKFNDFSQIYSHRTGNITINDQEVAYYKSFENTSCAICEENASYEHYKETPTILDTIEFNPEDTLIDMFKSVNFLSKRDEYIIFMRNIMSDTDDEPIGFKTKRIPSMEDAGLIELFDLKEEEKIIITNFVSFVKRIYS